MAAVMLAELRGLARLYRDGVDGVREQLMGIITASGPELPDVLGFPPANLERLHRSDDPVEVLVSTIEAVPRVVREARARAQREQARRLASGVAQSAVVVEGDLELDAALVSACCASWPGGGRLVFAERGAIDIRRLRALLKECRGLPISMLLTATSLIINWRTPHSRGHFKLTLWPGVADAVDLVIPTIDPPVAVPLVVPASSVLAANGLPEAFIRAGVTTAESSSTEDGVPGAQAGPGAVEETARAPETPSRVVEAPRRGITHRPPRRGIRARFIEAIAAAMGAP